MNTGGHSPELISATAPSKSPQASYRYGVAVLLVVAAAVVRLTVLQQLGARAAFLTFYPAVILAALYGGLGAGLLATMLSGCLANFFLMEPTWSLSIKSTSDWLSLLVFLLSGAMISWITGAMRRARERATKAETGAQLAAERERADRRLNRTLKALGHSNEAMVRARQEKQYLEQVCKIIVQDCDHAMVWIGFAEEDEAKTVRPVVHAGFEQGYIETLKITWADSERGRGPTGTAIRTGKPSACRQMLTDPAFSPWRDQAIKRGYASSVAVPLLANGKVFGAITLYSREPDAFSEEEQKLLAQLADDVAIALAKLRAEEALRQSEERYRTLFDTLIEGFCIIEMVFDAQGKPADYRFLVVNPAFEKQTGLQGAAGKLMRELAPEHEAHWFEIYGKVALTGEPARFVSEARALGRWYDVSAYRVGGADSRKVAILFNDITESKHAEEALRQAQCQLKAYAQDLEKTVASRTAKLQETIEELEHFSYAIVHDMRAPLRAMHSFAEMLLESCGKCENTDSQEYFRRIRIASNRMDRLITDSLNYSNAVRQELALEPVSLFPLLDSLVETYPNLQPDKVDIQIAPDLPTVLGNQAALTQCFSNLLDNAAKFSKPGAKPQIRIRAEASSDSANAPSSHPSNGFVRIWVEDDGIGIPKNAQERIFSLFQRATNDHEGTGIGLAIVQKVVQRMGGRVGVESEPGKGSRFWVELAKAS